MGAVELEARDEACLEEQRKHLQRKCSGRFIIDDKTRERMRQGRTEDQHVCSASNYHAARLVASPIITAGHSEKLMTNVADLLQNKRRN
jgi:hypothetical protein